MNSYKNDREWSDRFLSHVYKIVGPLLMEPASFELDAKQSTDLIVIKARDMRIGVRIRRPGFFDRFPNDITIRSARDTGTETELLKIMKGFGDWMFYGHSDKSEKSLVAWCLMDLNMWRYAMMTDRYTNQAHRKQISNRDGTHFVAFDVTKMPQGVLISSGGPLSNLNLKQQQEPTL